MNEEMRKALEEMLSTFKSGLKEGISKEEMAAGIDALKKDIEKKLDNALSKEDLAKAMEDFSLEISKDLEKFKTTTKVGNGAMITKELFDKAVEDFGKSGKATMTINKEAAAFTTANVTSGTHALSYEVVPGISAAPREPNAVLPELLKGMTSSRTIYWINRKNEDGGSAFIGEGVLKPLKDWEYGEESSLAKKVAVRAKVSREMLKDFAGFQTDMTNLLNVDLMEEIEDVLLTGTLSTTVPAGVLTVAGGYVTTALDDQVSLPNLADAIRATILQMRLLKYKPNVVFINPTEGALLDMLKDASGNYIRVQVAGILRTVRVIETLSIPAGNFLVMDVSKWVVKMLEGVTLEFGLDGDDFSKNMISVICEARLHSYYNSIDAGAFVYEDFATVLAAIEKPLIVA